MGDSKKKKCWEYKRGINITIYLSRWKLPKLSIIIPMKYLIKGRKYLIGFLGYSSNLFYLIHYFLFLFTCIYTYIYIWTRDTGHCWKSKGELISDVLLWTPSHGQARVGRPARTYIQQPWPDTGCSIEDLPEVMDDRDEWQEKVREIHADSTT